MTQPRSNIALTVNPSLFSVAEQPVAAPQQRFSTNSISPIHLPNPAYNSSTTEHNVPINNSPSTVPESNIPSAHAYFGSNRSRDNNFIPHNRQNVFSFRHEGLRRNRVVQIPSSRDIQELDRAPINTNLPNNQREVTITIEEDEKENADETRQAQSTNNNQPETTAEQNLRRLAVRRLELQFIFNLILLVINTFAELLVENLISVVAIFVLFNAFAIIYIVILIKTKDFSERLDRSSLTLSVANTLSLMIYMAIAFMKTYNIKIALAPFSVFGFCVVFGFCCRHNVDTPSSSKFILFLLKIVLWVELLLIGLSVDENQIPWATTFIPLYFSLMVLVFSSVLIIIASIITFFAIAREEGISLKLVIGIIWYLLNSFYPGIWLTQATKLAQYLGGDTVNLSLFLKIGIIHSGALLLYSLVFWKFISKFQQFEIQSEMLFIQSPQETANEEEPARQKQVVFKAFKDNRTNLVMISPTFYSFLDKHLKPKVNKKEIEKLKNEAQKSKLEKVHHKLKLNMPHKSAGPGAGDATGINKLTTTIESDNPISKHNLDFSDGDIDIKKVTMPKSKKEENNKGNDNLCIVCYDKVPNAIFMNCGHGGVCYDCALESWKRTEDCILCRKKISRVLKIVNFKPLKIIKVVESTKKVLDRS